ncbi:MAG: LON peptidase substrate-binding domain-containing protein [Rhodospirillaceae bacterium]
MFSPVSTKPSDLPKELPVFPLSGALLLPAGRLPLNLFEPRYLNMSLDALATGRIIGMIQPNYDAMGGMPPSDEDDDDIGADVDLESGAPLDLQDDQAPPLYKTGCAGRIVYFEETDDGRLLIALKGLSRFHVVEELDSVKGYRRVRADYGAFPDDMKPPQEFDLDRESLLDTLQPYIDAQGMRLKVEIIKGLSDHTLVSSLCMICPFDPREKQALLESKTPQDRADMLHALLQMGVFTTGTSDGPRQN